MTGFVAGRVMVPVVPDLRGFQKTVGKQGVVTGNVMSQNLTKSTQSSFSKLGGVATRGFKRGLKVGGLAATITTGLAIKGGITRLMGIEDARASLDGLGHDAKAIDKIMKNALNSVKGTAFGMADAGKAAASAVAAGVKPGKDLERTLKLTGDAATIAKVSFGEMSSVFGKVAASNKIQGDVIAQLNDQGIPIVQLLSKELGKSADETLKLASKGEINFKTFQNAMETGLGGAAKKSGDTMRGSFANMNAALGRVGANLLSGFFPKVRGGFQGITKALGPMEDKATVAGKALGDFSAKYGPKVATAFKAVGSAIHTIAARYGPALVSIVKEIATRFVGLVKFGTRVAKVLWDYKEVVGVLVAGLVAYKAIQLAVNAAGWASYLWQSREVLIGATRIAITKAMTASQLSLNAAMRANMLGLIITGVTLLVAGLVIAYKRSETFRNIVNATWASIKTGLATAWTYIKPVLGALRDFFGKVIPPAVKVLQTVFKVVFTAISIQVKVWWWAVRSYFGMLKAFLTGVLFPVLRSLYENVVKPVFSKVGSVISTVWTSVIQPTFSKIRSGVGKVKSAFSTAVDGIKSVWNGIREAMATPVNWVINNVINKLISAINKIPGVKDIKPIGLIGGGNEIATERPGHGQTAQGGKGARGGRNWGGKSGGSKSGGSHTWPANTHTLSNNYAGHSGIDIAAAMGSPIRAASGGTVDYTGWGRGYGQAIMVRGDDGLLQIYGHSSKVNVKAGQRVSAGQTLGLVGSTGNSSGPHLHFEIAKSAPGATSNRAATLAWLGGAKMGSGTSELDSFKSSVGKVSSSGAPTGSWLNIGALTGYLKDAALSTGKRILGAPIDAAKAVGVGAKNLAGKLNPIGGIGGKPKKPTAASIRAEKRRKANEAKRKKAAAARKAAIAKQKRDRLKIARALPTALSKAEKGTLKKSTSSLMIGNGASITDGFIRGQISAVAPSEATLKSRYNGAQSSHLAAADRKTEADRNLAIARANNQNKKSVATGKALAKAERERAAAVKALSAAQKAATAAANAYREAQDKAIERATNVRDKGIGLGSMASAPFKTAGGITSNLRKAVATTRTWGNVVSNLIKAGLRGPILEEFISEGPSASAVFTGKSLLASGQIPTINALQDQLRAEAISAASKATSTSGAATPAAIVSKSAPAGSWGGAINRRIQAGIKAGQGTQGSSATVIYSGMPSDTVESIVVKTADRVERILARSGA